MTEALVAVVVLAVLVTAVAAALVSWTHARAAAAWTVAIGQAQQLALVGLETSEQVRARRGDHSAGEDDEYREAHVGLVHGISDRELRDAARRGAPGAQRPNREFNADENAGGGRFREPAEAFDGEGAPG